MNDDQLKMLANSLKVADLLNSGINILDIQKEVHETRYLISNINFISPDYLNQFISQKTRKYYHELYRSNLLCCYHIHNTHEVYTVLVNLNNFLTSKLNRTLFLIPVKHLTLECLKSTFLK